MNDEWIGSLAAQGRIGEDVEYLDNVTPGFRYDHYSLNTGPRGQSGESEMSPKVGLSFRTTEWLTIWGGYSELFRSGLTEVFAEGLHFRGIPGVFPDNFCRHLSLIDEAGRNFKVMVSYQF